MPLYFIGWNIGYLRGLEDKQYPKKIRTPLFSHNVSKITAFDFFFGNGSRLLSPTEHFKRLQKKMRRKLQTIEFKDMKSVANYKPIGPTHVILNDHRVELYGLFDDYYTDRYLQAIRCDLMPGLNNLYRFNSNQLNSEAISVVAHIRAGDLIASKGVYSRRNSRIQNLESYFKAFHVIQKMFPNAKLFAYTSTVDPDSEFDRLLTEKFEERGIKIHLDSELGDIRDVTDSAIKSFASLIRADILLLAKSSFSHVAGIYNPNCVVYEEYSGPFRVFWESYLPRRWIGLKNVSFEVENEILLQEKLPLCLQHRQSKICDY